MISRAHMLIARDIQEFQDTDPWGITLENARENSMFEWIAKMHGLQNTPWQDGIFRLYIKFDENYNIRPPELFFHTIPFHPNIDMITGKPCLNITDDPSVWNTSYTLTHILLAIQVMISFANTHQAVNPDAVSMLQHSPSSYAQIVEDCVKASQRVEAGLPPHVSDRQPLPPSKSLPLAYTHLMPFEDYYAHWTTIATSYHKPTTIATKEFIQKHKELRMGARVNRERLVELQRNRDLVFGINNNNLYDVRAKKVAKLEYMKQMYFPESSVPSTKSQHRLSSDIGGIDRSHPNTSRESSTSHLMSIANDFSINEQENDEHKVMCEEEVDALMAWTQSLSVEIVS